MHPPPPDPADDAEERRIEHRFAELVRRFWRGTERPEAGPAIALTPPLQQEDRP